MKKNWNDEWDMEESEVNSIVESWITFRDCEHSWVPAPPTEGALSWIDLICEKCGGAQITMSREQMEPLLPNDKVRGSHCL